MEKPTKGIAELVNDALVKLRELASRSTSTADLLAKWSPTVVVVQKLGFTLFQVANHLVAAATDDDVELMPSDLAAELRADLTELAQAFPGVDEVIFGTDTVDELIDAAMADSGVKSAMLGAARAVGRKFDALIEKLIAIAIDPESAGFSQNQLVEYLAGVERILDKMLDRWLAETTGTN